MHVADVKLPSGSLHEMTVLSLRWPHQGVTLHTRITQLKGKLLGINTAIEYAQMLKEVIQHMCGA